MIAAGIYFCHIYKVKSILFDNLNRYIRGDSMDIKSTNMDAVVNQNIYLEKNDVNVKLHSVSQASDENSKNEVNRKKLDKSIDIANNVLFKNNTHLKFQIHEVTKDIMVEIVDDKTGDVLKEIPPKKIIDMVADMCEALGIFVDKKR